VTGYSRTAKSCGNIILMAGNDGGGAVTHFGRQLRKERVAHGWSIHELSARTGIAAGHLSRIENGKRPPTAYVAAACDAAFPERHGWFGEYYEESKSWVPAGFRSWSEYEDKATTLRAWSPGVLHGLLQTDDYARALLETAPGVSAEVVKARLTSRIERQRRVLTREDPPSAWFIIDQLSLYRQVGSAEAMVGQMRHLAEIARRPNVTVQVLPAVAHPATQSGFMVTDSAAYAESVVSGQVFSDTETVNGLLRMFDTLRGESYRVSDSLSMVLEVGEIWTGESPATAGPTAETA